MATKSILVSDLTGKPITAADKPLFISCYGDTQTPNSYSLSTIRNDDTQKRVSLGGRAFKGEEIVLTASDLASLLGFSIKSERDSEREKQELDRMYEDRVRDGGSW